MSRFILSCLILCVSCAPSATEDDNLLLSLMRREPAKFQYVLDHRDSLEVQVIYTQINRDANNQPIFKSFYFNVDSTHYFYPASTIKLPLVLLAFEKLNKLGIRGLSKFTPVFFDSVYSGQRSVRADNTEANGLPTIAGYARKILLVSDNNASNCLYEFLGQRCIYDSFKNKGYNIRITHRLNRPLTPDQDRHTEAVRFVRGDSLLYSQPMLVNTDSIKPLRRELRGKGYWENGELVQRPFDFTYKNFYPLEEQQEILKSIFFPGALDARKRFDLSEDDRKFLFQYMGYAATDRPSGKLLMYADDPTPMPASIRIFSKTGGAYGYLVDNAYIVDFDKGVEFMLSAVINTNRDGIYNDDKYDYKTLGNPFMRDLGRLIYSYDLRRRRERRPDLTELKEALSVK